VYLSFDNYIFSWVSNRDFFDDVCCLFSNGVVTKKENQMGDLRRFAQKNSKFIKLKSGEHFIGVFLGYSFSQDMNGNETVLYKFKDSEEQEKTLQSSGRSLCEFFDNVDGQGKINDMVKIIRDGEARQTRYRCEILKDNVPF